MSQENPAMRIFALLITLLWFNAVYAAPPGCQELADKVTKKFEAAKKMTGIDRAAQCTAINLAISDLADMYGRCAFDENFRNEVYIPLAQRMGAEAPKACAK
jgi:hypothetical protein